jgi:hypothetical protein
MRYGDIALPISYEPICKDRSFCDVKTKREKRKSSTSKNEIFRSIIARGKKNEVLFEYVLADN